MASAELLLALKKQEREEEDEEEDEDDSEGIHAIVWGMLERSDPSGALFP